MSLTIDADRKYCGFATDNIEGTRTVGMHICDREPGHDGPHKCDICPHEWSDPTPEVTSGAVADD